MLFLLTISVESLTGYDDIVWQFAQCTFNSHGWPANKMRARTKKSNKLWKSYTYIYIYIYIYILAYFLFQIKPQDMLMQ